MIFLLHRNDMENIYFFIKINYIFRDIVRIIKMSKFTKKNNNLTDSYIYKLLSNKSAHFYDFHYVT